MKNRWYEEFNKTFNHILVRDFLGKNSGVRYDIDVPAPVWIDMIVKIKELDLDYEMKFYESANFGIALKGFKAEVLKAIYAEIERKINA